MDTQQPSRRAPKIKFRVLIIGRANAGKTSILQRICETTESPIIYRRGEDPDSDEEVKLDPTMDRGEHSIDDQLVFSNNTGYVFHDSCGIESGCTKELEVLREFIRRKCGEKRLGDKLHAIWYCIPMDNQRPGLDLKFFNDICPDQNVPVIGVFTKYDQFRRNVKIDLMDYGNPDDSVTEVTEKLFQEHYLHPLGDHVVFVRLEQMHRPNRRCDDLIEKTAAALNGDTVTLMLIAVQKSNLELSVKAALKRVHSGAAFEVEGAASIVQKCLFAFPYLWWYEDLEEEEDDDFFLEDDEDFFFFDDRDRYEFDRLERLTAHVMSLPTFQNLSGVGLSCHHLILVAILIFKHATFLRLPNSSCRLALTRAELDYRHANTDSHIRQCLLASSQEHSVELFSTFIMATDIVPSQSSVEHRLHRKDP